MVYQLINLQLSLPVITTECLEKCAYTNVETSTRIFDQVFAPQSVNGHRCSSWIRVRIVIEIFYSSLELRQRLPGKTCWTVGLISLIDTNVPLGAEPFAPTETPPMPVQTPVTTTPTQVETVKTPSTATPTRQPATPDQLSGMVIPIVVAVAGAVAVLAVFKILRK